MAGTIDQNHAMIFRERIAEYRDQAGELVITARGVSVTTERPVDQG